MLLFLVSCTGVEALPMSPWSARYSHADGDAADIEVPLEMVLDLGARPRFADLAEVIDHRREQRRRALGQVVVDRLERRLPPETS